MPTATKFAARTLLRDHFVKHGSEIGATDRDDYETKAVAFLNKSIEPNGSIEQQTQISGEVVRYDKTTNEFAIMAPDGIIVTYYLPMMRSRRPAGYPINKTHTEPSNYDYFLRECRKISS